MQRYVSCSNCGGKGKLDCISCICPSCNGNKFVTCIDCKGSGNVSCNHCISGHKPCPNCHGKGEVVAKWLVFNITEVCPVCENSKEVDCEYCEGSATKTCPECNGEKQVLCKFCNNIGHIANCKICSDTHYIKCEKCYGSGQIESNAFRNYNQYSKERLIRERESLHFKISNKQMEILRYEAEYKQASSEWNAFVDRIGGYRNVHVGENWTDSILQVIHRAEDEIHKFEDELETVELVLNSRD